VVKLGEPIEPVREALVQAVEELASKPPTTEELERVRRSWLNTIERSLNNPPAVGVALSEPTALGDWRMYCVGGERVQRMTAEQVAASAGRYYLRSNRTVGTFIPEEAAKRAELPPAPTVLDAMKDFKPAVSTLVAENFDPSQHNIMKRT
ncbi:hypothetical protein PV941_12620, partial [Ligilactobacillus salivarius]|nr:hypothetical protein [Ligilactobacillus salivarius]